MQSHTFIPHNSGCLLLLSCFLHGLAALAIGLITLSLTLKIPLWMGCAISLGFALSRHNYRLQPTAIIALHKQADQWLITLRNGATLTTESPKKIFKSPGLVILNFACPGVRRQIPAVIFFDALPKAQFRQLRAMIQ